MVRWWTGVLPSPLPRQIDLTIIVVYTEILKSKKHSNPHPPPPPLHCNKPRTEVGKSLHLLRCPRHSRHKESLLSGTENLRNSWFSCWLGNFNLIFFLWLFTVLQILPNSPCLSFIYCPQRSFVQLPPLFVSILVILRTLSSAFFFFGFNQLFKKEEMPLN